MILGRRGLFRVSGRRYNRRRSVGLLTEEGNGTRPRTVPACSFSLRPSRFAPRPRTFDLRPDLYDHSTHCTRSLRVPTYKGPNSPFWAVGGLTLRSDRCKAIFRNVKPAKHDHIRSMAPQLSTDVASALRNGVGPDPDQTDPPANWRAVLGLAAMARTLPRCRKQR